jgi:hypothetical protein
MPFGVIMTTKVKAVMEATDGSAPSEARKRGSGGGSPRKYDDVLTGPSDLDVQSTQSST